MKLNLTRRPTASASEARASAATSTPTARNARPASADDSSAFSVPGGDSQTGSVFRLLCFALVAVSLLFATGCEEGGIGDPCIPEDEYRDTFSGYSKDEVNVESRSFQCETRVCLVNKFQGRVSCKYGQAASSMGCKTPDESNDITVPVEPQLEDRRPNTAVYCSCRCKGPQSNAPYCECPDGFQCIDLIDDIGLGNAQLAGGYCVKSGTEKDSDAIGDKRCEETAGGNNCGPASNYYE